MPAFKNHCLIIVILLDYNFYRIFVNIFYNEAYSTRSSDSTTHTTTTHARTNARAENDASVSQSSVFAIILPIALCAIIISTILGLIQCARRGNRPICCRSAARQQRRQQLQLQLQRLQELQLRQQQRQQLLEQQQQRQRRQQQQQQDETPSGLTTSVMDILDLYYVNPVNK